VDRPGELTRTQVVPRPVDEAFAFFADPHNLEAITPPWLGFRIVSAPAELERGALIRYRLRLKGIPVRWLTEIRAWSPPRSFVDVQLRGPYLRWEHAHRLVPVAGGTEIHDHVRYRVPGGRLVDGRLVRPLLEEIFDYRAERTAALLG
jgi:ligand-binding SRPBCC domain-containing protein